MYVANRAKEVYFTQYLDYTSLYARDGNSLKQNYTSKKPKSFNEHV